MNAVGGPFRPLVVTSNYPSAHHPDWGTFVAGLVRSWTRTGASATVLAPHPAWSPSTRRLVLHQPDEAGPGEPTVLRPSFLPFSNRRIGPLRTMHWTLRSFESAAVRAANALPEPPSLVYSHFLFPAGPTALRLARRFGVPAVVALGESGFTLYERTISRDRIVATMRGFDAAVSVSRFNRDWCAEHYGFDVQRIRVEPNATDTDLFHPRDRARMRRELGLPLDRVIVGFSGALGERKGPLRLLEAIRGLPEVAAVFLGDGPHRPQGEQVLAVRKVVHSEVARWLAAVDLYVLPTLEEGSPNSVIEAMACGLPIISSDLPSLHETTDSSCAVLVDPLDVQALRAEIQALARDPERRARMGEAARRRACRSSLAARAERIRGFLEEVQCAGDRAR